jgi:hypothetical protein
MFDVHRPAEVHGRHDEVLVDEGLETALEVVLC